MASFGSKSQERLSTCHEDMQKICNFVIRFYDFSVLEGVRETARQQQLFAEGKSKLDGITKKSKHQPNEDGVSMAVDVAPYPIDFSDEPKTLARFYFLMGMMKMAAEMLYDAGEITHRLRFGLDWDMDNSFTDQNFDDLPHMELIIV